MIKLMILGWDPPVLKVGPNDLVFSQEKWEGRRAHDDRSRSWSNVATSQGTPRVTESQWKTKAWHRVSLRGSRTNPPCWHLDVKLLTSRKNLYCFKPHSLWKFVMATLGNYSIKSKNFKNGFEQNRKAHLPYFIFPESWEYLGLKRN